MLESELAFKSVFRDRGSAAAEVGREQDADSIPPAIPHIYQGIEMSLFSSNGSKATGIAELPRGAWQGLIIKNESGLQYFT